MKNYSCNDSLTHSVKADSNNIRRIAVALDTITVQPNANGEITFDYSAQSFISKPYVFATVELFSTPNLFSTLVRNCDNHSAVIRVFNGASTAQTISVNMLAIGSVEL